MTKKELIQLIAPFRDDIEIRYADPEDGDMPFDIYHVKEGPPDSLLLSGFDESFGIKKGYLIQLKLEKK